MQDLAVSCHPGRDAVRSAAAQTRDLGAGAWKPELHSHFARLIDVALSSRLSLRSAGMT